MSRATVIAATAVVLGTMASCAPALEEPSPRTTQDPTPSSTVDCPDLAANLPPDLRRVERLVEADMPAPHPVRIVYEDGSGHRSAVLMSSSTTQPRGHAYPGTPRPTSVGGQPGTVNEHDGRMFIRWSVQDNMTCPHRTVIASGLTGTETDEILTTVQVDSRHPA